MPGLAVHLLLFFSGTVVLSMGGVGAMRVSALGRAWALGLTDGGVVMRVALHHFNIGHTCRSQRHP